MIILRVCRYSNILTVSQVQNISNKRQGTQNILIRNSNQGECTYDRSFACSTCLFLDLTFELIFNNRLPQIYNCNIIGQDMKTELPITLPSILKRKTEIMARFNLDFQKRKVDALELQGQMNEIASRQSDLVKLTTLSQKEISKYFINFEPMKCNPATFLDLKLFGGPRIAINHNKLYIGTIFDGKRHGKGVIISQKGRIYEGQLLFNERNGVGVQIYQNANFYIGNFVNSKREGEGKMVWINRSQEGKVTFQYFSGSWKEGQPHGFGLHCTEEWKFFGNFKNGIRNGKGIQLKGATLFEGSFVNNLKESKGCYLDEQVQYFEGEFKNGQRNGYGKWKSFIAEQQYEGFFQNNKKEGIGAFSSKILTYRGLFTDDKPSGAGQYIPNVQTKSPKVHDDRVITELVIKKNVIGKKRGELQSAQFIRSKPSQLKSQLSLKSLQKIIKSHKTVNLNQSKDKDKDKDKNSQSQRNSLNSRASLSSIKMVRVTEQNPEKHSCTYKHCSCHKWSQTEKQKLKVDQKRILRLFSARKVLLKSIV